MNEREQYFYMLFDTLEDAKNIHTEASAILPLLVSVHECGEALYKRIDILLSQGANINAQTDQQDTAVILAGWAHKSLDLVRYLVERGADVNISNENGDTPLIDAAHLGTNDILKFLLQHGAERQFKNNAGLSARAMAEKSGNAVGLELLS